LALDVAPAVQFPRRVLRSTIHKLVIAVNRQLLVMAAEPEQAISEAIHGLALEQLVDQLPAALATALRLTVLEALSLRAAAERLEISAMSVMRAQKKAIAALRLQLSGGAEAPSSSACGAGLAKAIEGSAQL